MDALNKMNYMISCVCFLTFIRFHAKIMEFKVYVLNIFLPLKRKPRFFASVKITGTEPRADESRRDNHACYPWFRSMKVESSSNETRLLGRPAPLR